MCNKVLTQARKVRLIAIVINNLETIKQRSFIIQITEQLFVFDKSQRVFSIRVCFPFKCLTSLNVKRYLNRGKIKIIK